jgi:hypothetical protein
MERGTAHASYALSALFGRHGCLLENSARFCFVFEFCFFKNKCRPRREEEDHLKLAAVGCRA